jgi:hypothetical protein
MYTYGCTPICVNGVVDMGVYEFQKDLIDGVIEKAFVRDAHCQDMAAAWRRFGMRMVPAVRKLLASPAPVLPAIDYVHRMPDTDEGAAENMGNSRSVHYGHGSGIDAVMGRSWDMGLAAPGHEIQGGTPGHSLDFAAQHDSSHMLRPYSQFARPSESSGENLRASDLDRSLPPNLCIDPALIQESCAVAALSASIASMEVEPGAAQPIVETKSPLAEPIEAKSPPAEPIEAESPPAEPIEAESPPATPMEAESPPAEPMQAESSPATPMQVESPPAEPIEAESPPAEPTEAKLQPAEPIEAESPPAEPIEAEPSSPAGPIEAESPLAESIQAELSDAEPVEAETPAANTSEAGLPPMQPIAWATIATARGPFSDSESLSDEDEPKATSRKGRGTPAATNKKAAKSKSKSAAAPGAPDSAKKHGSGRRLAKNTGDHAASKRLRSPSMESEDALSLPVATGGNKRLSRPAPKKKRLASPADVAPMIAAFPLSPATAEGPIMEYGDLLQPSVESTDSASDKRVMEVNLPGPRMVMELQLPTTIYNKETDELRIETQTFLFPYQAMVWLIVQRCIELDLFALSCAGRRCGKAPTRRRSGRVFAFSHNLFTMNICSRTASPSCRW